MPFCGDARGLVYDATDDIPASIPPKKMSVLFDECVIELCVTCAVGVS
jgi:hypothetical protein